MLKNRNMFINFFFIFIILSTLLFFVSCEEETSDSNNSDDLNIENSENSNNLENTDKNAENTDTNSNNVSNNDSNNENAENAENNKNAETNNTTDPPEWRVGNVLAWKNDGVLASVQTGYGELFITRIKGSYYDMGYQYGYLLGQMIIDMWWTYMENFAEELGYDAEVTDNIIGDLLDKVWDQHMGVQIPDDYKDEFEGIEDGAEEAGYFYKPDKDLSVSDLVRRILTLADVAMADEMGDLTAMLRLIDQGFSDRALEFYEQTSIYNESSNIYEYASLLPPDFKLPKMACSYFAAWGERTVDGKLYASRNLDYATDTGISNYKLITVFEPEGKNATVSVGFAGFTGILAGLNEKGVAVGHVGSTSVLERLAAEPGLLKSREALEKGSNVDEAFPYLTNEVNDGINRPNTIGANAMFIWGDPEGSGANAQGVAVELNGIFANVYKHSPDCSVEGFVYEFGQDGTLTSVKTSTDNPEVVNLESETYEINRDGNIRYFVKDEQGNPTIDENGAYIESEEDGEPISVGLPLSCAFYRGDEALSYAVRKWQLCSNGPQRDGNTRLLSTSGSYKKRYKISHDIIQSFENGTELMWEEEVLVPDNNGEKKLIGLSESQLIAKTAAMDSNVFAVVYDATDLIISVAFESGTGDNWVRASDNEFYNISLADLLLWEQN